MIDPRPASDRYDEARFALQKTIRRLYRLFAHRRRGSRPWADMDFPREKLDLPERSTVEELEVDDYLHLSWHALCFDGVEPDTVKYFLPRILEEFARCNRHGPILPEMLISQMNQCKWRTWRPIEVEAIENYFVAWFTEALLDPTLRVSLWVDERLKVIAFSGTAIESYLELWRNERTLLSAIKLADFLRSNLPRKKEAFPRRWDNVWGNERVNQAAISAVRGFVISRDTHDFLEGAFFHAKLPDEQEVLSLAVELVQIMQKQQE